MNEETEPVITLEMFQERQARITEALDACLRKSDRTPLAPDLPLFATGTGRAMRAGVTNANLHRFRHTFAINYLRQYPNVYTLQRVLGHSSLDTVRIYLAISEADIHDAHKRASVADNWRL